MVTLKATVQGRNYQGISMFKFLLPIFTILSLTSQVPSTSIPRPEPLALVRIDNLSDNCPYTAVLSNDPLSQDSSILTITYGTANTSSSVVALGPRIPTSNNTRTCRLALEIKFDATSYTVNVKGASLNGGVTLDRNIQASVDMTAVWDGNSGLDHFNPIILPGPIQNAFNASTTNATSFTSPCAPYDAGATLNLLTRFSVWSNDDDAAGSAAGVIGIGRAVVQTVVLGWESCRASECVDRNGIRFC